MANLEKQKEKHNKSKFYDGSGEKAERKGKFCPKCGPGVFMAEHKERYACGTCGYTEMKGGENSAGKEAQKKPEEAPKGNAPVQEKGQEGTDKPEAQEEKKEQEKPSEGNRENGKKPEEGADEGEEKSEKKNA